MTSLKQIEAFLKKSPCEILDSHRPGLSRKMRETHLEHRTATHNSRPGPYFKTRACSVLVSSLLARADEVID